MPANVSSFEPFSNPIELFLIVACIVLIAFGLFGVLSSSAALKKKDNPHREMVTDFFRSLDGVTPQSAISSSDFPFWLNNPSNEKSTFDALLRKGVIKKEGSSYWLDEQALQNLLGQNYSGNNSQYKE